MDLVQKANDTLKQMLELHASTDWQKIKETPHCIVYSKPSTFFKGNVYKSEGVIPAPIASVFDLIYPGAEKPRRKEWDNTVDSIVLIKPAPDVDVIRSRTAPVCMGMISAREFVDLVKVVREDRKIFTAACSIDLPQAPPSKEFVRGFNYPNSVMCQAHPEKPDHTILTQYVHSDIGGSLPRALVEGAIATTAAESYPKVKAVLIKDAAPQMELD